jgi:hypothetical protein
MSDEEHEDQRAEIFERVCDLIEELESEGTCPCCIATVLLMVTVARGGCANAIKALSPQGLSELRAALDQATAAH